ncbi:LysE family translocator [Aliivibrio fischeri]|uniref:LysE family translocator n=1 Tax=Aliivibrio fischeri TaxID=668 RepID=UPI001F44CD76|nr:LysE family translocator [Aliivibrio fischeri]MCE7553960.1 LysE family translocator [Aliivibrio fischeri]MCE7561188.1 LysE family translocator [Aliivibrio fischeri]MCE7568596.1 LysE family translocator [Aliivibrio fischeri]
MELFSLIILGVLIVISPGADFILVLKNSINHGRNSGIWTAIGISLAIIIHISYSLLGIGYLISQNELLFNLVRYAGSAYLIYLGTKSICSASAQIDITEQDKDKIKTSNFFIQGFLCNALNPKTMLFFLSIFSQVMSLESGDHLALFYGVYIVTLHFLWFSCVAILFTSRKLQTHLLKMKKKLNQVCGAGLLIFGVLLGVTS